ncbi:MAG: hypothetical protein IJC46_04165 [Clostridia bacterium]|nr:hypothetical protein [Clostridia bacterium]
MTRTYKRTAQILMGAIPLALIGFITFTAVYSADDFSYSTYFDGGLSEYLARMLEHYRTMNGRVVVHVVAHIVLFLGNFAFAACGMLACFSIPWFCARSNGRSKAAAFWGVGIFCLGLMAAPPSVLRESLLWLSAFCNYALPTAMLCLLLFFSNRLYGREKTPILPFALLGVYGFLCGATTEQSGPLAILLLLFFAAKAVPHNKKSILPFLLCAITAALGTATIFASPATATRTAIETGNGGSGITLDAIAASFSQFRTLVDDTPFFAILSVALLAVGGFKSGSKCKHPRLALLFLLPAAVAMAVPFTDGLLADACLGLSLLGIIALAVFLLLYRETNVGLLLLLGIGSLLIVLPTDSVGGRTLLPLILYFLAAITLLLCDLTESCRAAVPLSLWTAILAFAMIAILPLIRGCFINFTVEQRNLAHAREAKESGVLYYCVDYDLNYTHSKPYTYDYCLKTYYGSVGLTEDEVAFYCYSDRHPTLYAEERRVSLPLLQNEAGERLYPLRKFYETLGAILEWNQATQSCIVHYGARCFEIIYLSATEVQVNWTDSDGQPQSLRAARFCDTPTYVGEAVITEPFGLSITETDDNKLIVTP